MSKNTRKNTGRSVSRRHSSRWSSSSMSRKSQKPIGDDEFYRLAAEADRILELEFADDDPDGIRLSHK